MQGNKAIYLALLLICTVSISRAQRSSKPVRASVASVSRADLGSNYGNLPLIFEANQGQADGQIRYMSRGDNYSVYLTATGMLLALHLPEATPPIQDPRALPSVHNPPFTSPIHQLEKTIRARRSTILAIDLVGASRNAKVVGEDPFATRVNYFIGRDPSKWLRNVPAYRKVRYSNVYPGIDLVYYGNNHKVEYDFDVAPGADATNIQFAVKGAASLAVDSQGNLVLTKAGRTLQFQMPEIYQEIHGQRTRLSGTYQLRDSIHVGFAVGHYDRTKPLVIDPVLEYSTFLGGSSDTFGFGIAVDSAGEALVTGITDSTDFPVAGIGSYNPSQFRMFLTKFDRSGSSLLFADYFGGTIGADDPYAIAVDSAGDVYITGGTASADFPLVSPYQSSFSGTQDAFLLKFSADGSSIIYSTYLGGSNLTSIGGTTSQTGTSVSVDSAGEAVIAGFTAATDFPTVGAYQHSVSADQFGNWGLYGFITKFAPDGASLVYSTYLAGSTYNVSSCVSCFPESSIMSVATDGTGNAYVTGWTDTADFPVTPGALLTSSPANPLSDVGFVSKFSNSGAITYSTYMGGASSALEAIAVDGTGSAYVAGFASSDDGFPTTSIGICDPSAVPCNGAVVAKLDPSGSNLIYSTFLGTSNNMLAQAIQVDVGGDAFIAGSDLQFDIVNPIEQYAGRGDIVVAEIDPSGNELLLATFLGGQGLEAAAGLALDNNGAVYVTGLTESADFPVTSSAFQTLLTGSNAAFVAKIDPAGSGPSISMGPPSLQFTSQSVGSTSAPQTSILRNMSSAQLTINSKSISGDFAESDDCGNTVAPASQCTFSITFTPAASGARLGTLTITDDTQIGSHAVALTGVGSGASAAVSISPSTLNFAPSSLGTPSATQTVTFANNGDAPVVVSEIEVNGNFQNAGSTCGTVSAHATCTVQVSFVPASPGPLTGSLQFFDSATDSPQVVPLSGSGMDFVTSTQSSSATVTPGGTASYELSIRPAGGSFTSAIRMACTGAPAFASCSVNPSSITPGSNSLNATVKVTTSARSQAHAGFIHGQFPPPGMFLLFAAFGALLISARDRRKFRLCLASGTMLMILLLAGCSGVSSGKTANSGTIALGTYSLTVTATSGNLQHSTILTLVVK